MQENNRKPKLIGYLIAAVFGIGSVWAEWNGFYESNYMSWDFQHIRLVLVLALVFCIFYNIAAIAFAYKKGRLVLFYFGGAMAGLLWFLLKYVLLYSLLRGYASWKYHIFTVGLVAASSAFVCILVLVFQLFFEFVLYLCSKVKMDMEEEPEVIQIGKTPRFLLLLLCGLTTLVVLHEISADYMAGYRYYYRTWFEILFYFLKWYCIPLLSFGFVISILYQRRKKVIALLGMLVCSIFIIAELMLTSIWFGLSYKESFEKEEKIGEQLLRGSTNYGGSYYESYNFLLKRGCRSNEQAIQLFLSANEQEEFRVQMADVSLRMQNEKAYYAQAVENSSKNYESIADIVIHVGYTEGLDIFWHDYNMARSYWQIEQFLEKNKSDRKVIAYRKDDFLIKDIRVFCTPQDYEDCAKEVAEMITYMLQDAFFSTEGHGGYLTVVCGMDVNNHNTVTLNFGNIPGKTRDKYTDKEAVFEELDKVFKDNIYTQENMWKENIWNEVTGENPYTEEDASYTADEARELLEADIATPEGAFRQLYETMFEKEGYQYMTAYNAKGNFYVILEETDVDDESETKRSVYSVVYDRPSKNAKCQLFVAYRTHYAADGTEISAVIENTYAVNMSTKEVAASGKKNWSDTGSKEYREMTGEP